MTNLHVIRTAQSISLKLVDGQPLYPQALDIAAEQDAARFLFQTPGRDPAPLKLADTLPAIDHRIVIYGDSEAMGAVTELTGKVLGVGPDVLEVDAGFVRGNSGSPILDERGEVIGIATFVTLDLPGRDWVVEGTRFVKTRRFGVRLTDNIRWISVNPRILYQQTKLLDDSINHLGGVFSLLHCWIPGSERAQARMDLFAYVNNRNPDYFGQTSWENRFQEFVRFYRRYWHSRSRFSEKSMSVQQSRRVLIEHFDALPMRPREELEKTRWLTPSLEQESKSIVAVMDLFQSEINKLINDDLRFWRNNIFEPNRRY